MEDIICIRKAEQILEKMTLREKIGQLNQENCVHKDQLEEFKAKIRKGEIGSLMFSNSATAGNDEQDRVLLSFINEMQQIALEESPNGIPILFGRDVIHGHNTVLPIPLALTATFNPELIKEGYRCVAKEACNDGINWTFAPMVDLSRDSRWGRCIEGIGEDPYLGGKIAKAIVEGFQGEDNTKQDSIAACAKHYIGYGAVEGGRDYGRAEISDYTLRNFYLPSFKAAVDSGVATIMSSFNEISGTSVTASKYMLTDILRDELKFKGFVVSDWESVEQLVDQGLANNKADAARMALNAGLDMNMVGRCYIENLETLVADGKVSEETIDAAVLRILYIKIKFGLFDIDSVKPMPFDEEKHIRLAKMCADESIVMLKNKNNILPLSKEKHVVVTGPFAHEKRSLLGSWTIDGDIKKVKTIKESIVATGAKVLDVSDSYLWDDCLTAIHNTDYIIVALGESRRLTGEANSVASIEIQKEQIEYIKKLRCANKPLIAIMCYGRPVALDEIEPYLDAIVYAWHGGTMIGPSIASVIYGEVNPSGKLPMTFPRCTGQIPIYYNAPECTRFCNSYYGQQAKDIFNYHDCQGTPMYPFGYGLSYTTFQYGEISCEETVLKLSQIENGKMFKFEIDVKNTGDVKGKEIVQCYVQDPFASMMRPKRELKGFGKIEINPGETQCVMFEIGFNELGFYNEKGKYSVEPGEFNIYIGGSSYADECVTIEVTE